MVFNIVNFLTAQAAVRAAVELKSPIILQTSVGTVKQIGPKELISILRELADGADVPVAVSRPARPSTRRPSRR